MRRSLGCVLISLLVTTASAKSSPPQRRVATVPLREMRVVSHFGDTVTKFEIESRDEGKNQIALYPMHGSSRKGPLHDADLRYILSEFEKLPVVKTIPVECGRAFMTVTVKLSTGEEKSKSSCLGVRTITEPKFRRFLNILNYAI